MPYDFSDSFIIRMLQAYPWQWMLFTLAGLFLAGISLRMLIGTLRLGYWIITALFILLLIVSLVALLIRATQS